MEGKLHIYHPKRHLLLFEYVVSSSDYQYRPVTDSNVLLFVGGMFDNFRTTSYVDLLAETLLGSSWRVCHVQLSSATRNFGTFNLTRDVEEIDSAVKFIRSTPQLGNPDTKIVLMGHSTGCQDTLTYIYSSTSTPRSPIQGAILQAAVSDRESAMNSVKTKKDVKTLYDQCMEIVTSTSTHHQKSTILPLHLTTPIFGPAPLSISRFLSLVSLESPNNPSADDLFSSDIPGSELKKTFGQIGATTSPLQPVPVSRKRTLMILLSGADEYCPAFVDKAFLLSRWKIAIDDGGGILHSKSQIIDNGLHDLSGDGPGQKYAREVVLKTAVVDYLEDVLGSKIAGKQFDHIHRDVAGLKL